VATTTGISGLTLGGGYGLADRKVRARLRQRAVVEVVLATVRSSIVMPREQELSGACAAPAPILGLPRKLEYRLHPLSEVFGGPFVLPAISRNHAPLREFSASIPDELTTFAAAAKLRTAHPYSPSSLATAVTRVMREVFAPIKTWRRH